MAPTKGKQATKGIKQIADENVTTLAFYRNMGLGCTAINLSMMLVFFSSQFTGGIIALLCLTIIIYVACYYLLKYAARPKYLENGQLLDSGTDLNLEGGFGEHIKDLIILTALTQLLSLIHNYFWLLLLLIPVRGFHLLWRSVLGPWFFQESEAQPEVDEKKQRKLDRKMRMQRT